MVFDQVKRCGDETRVVKTRLEITKKDALKMIKQSFLFNELLARKEFENASACKHKFLLTNKFKEEFFVPMHSKRDN